MSKQDTNTLCVVQHKTKERRAWTAMIQRCENPRCKSYHNYGGRGITVCGRWRRSFAAFLEDVGISPPNSSLDRIDNDGNYEPGNCRWATKSQQQANRRNTVLLEFGGKKQCIKDWARELGIHVATIRGRLAAGWPAEQALTKSPNSGRVRKTASRGEVHPCAKITLETAKLIRAEYANGDATFRSLARKYNLSKGHVYRIVKKGMWSE